MPTTPSCQSGDASTYALRSRHSDPRASICSSASRTIPSSTICRSRLSDSSRVASARARDASPVKQQFERLVRVAQAAGGIDARREPEADVGGAHPCAVDSRSGHERPQPRPRGAGKPAQAGPHQAAVLVLERYHVRDRRQRDQVEVRLERRRVAARLGIQRLGELEDDTRARQLGKRVVRRPGAHQWTGGQGVAGTVVVGHDHIHAEGCGAGDLIGGGDAAVDGDQQCNAVAGEPLDRLGGEAVALVEAAR